MSQSLTSLANLIPGSVGETLARQGTGVSNAILDAARRAAERAASIRSQLEGSRRGQSALPPDTGPGPVGLPNPTAPEAPGFRPTSSPLDAPFGSIGQVQAAVATATRSAIQTVGTAIGGFRTGLENQLDRDMLIAARRQVTLLQEIRDEVLSGGGGAFT